MSGNFLIQRASTFDHDEQEGKAAALADRWVDGGGHRSVSRQNP